MKAVSQTGSQRSVPPVQLPQPPGTTLTNGHEAPLPARSPRPTAPADCTADDFCRLVPLGQFGRGQRHKTLTNSCGREPNRFPCGPSLLLSCATWWTTQGGSSPRKSCSKPCGP